MTRRTTRGRRQDPCGTNVAFRASRIGGHGNQTSQFSRLPEIRPLVLSSGVASHLKSRAFLYAELSKFTQSGFGIDKACESIIDQPASDRTAREICRALLEGTRSGKSLAGSLAENRGYPISDLEIAMVDAAERGGRLELGFHHLAEHFRLEADARRRIRRALVYPLVLLHFALAVGIGMTTVMRNLGASLTGAGFAQGDFDWKASVLSNLAWVGFAYLIALGLVFGWRRLSRAGENHPGIDAWMQRLPLAGPVRRSRSLARFCEVLHLYLLSGQHMDRAWKKAGEASRGGQLGAYAQRTAPRLAAGESISEVVASAGPALPGDLVRGLASADVAGALDLETARWSSYYREASAESVEHLAEWAPKLFYWLVLVVAAWMIIRAALSYNELLSGLIDFTG